MSSLTNTSISSVDTGTTNTVAKLRRLKIQENVLSNAVNCAQRSNFYVNDEVSSKIEFKKYSSNFTNSIIEAKNLFEEIKYHSEKKELLEEIDIVDMKKNVTNLEDKIKTLQIFIKKELSDLKNEENLIMKQLQENPAKSFKSIYRSKSLTKPFVEVVPSPVKFIINSPLKYPEVQQFQDFITNTPKFGGWNEYNHNIFIHSWRKSFKDFNIDCEEQSIGDHANFDDFVDDLYEKISGINIHDVLSHCKWYSQYLFYKYQQQAALDKWKAKRRVIKRKPIQNDILDKRSNTDSGRNKGKRVCSKVQTVNIDDEKTLPFNMDKDMIFTSFEDLSQIDECSSNSNETSLFKSLEGKNERVNNRLRLVKPTKQWLNRCNSEKDFKQIINNLEDIKKLRIPDWRKDF